MSDELKPCPWEKPGERHDLEMVDVGALVWVRCATCMAAGPCEDSREKATAAWNARAAVTDEQFAMAVHDGEVWQRVRECEMIDLDNVRWDKYEGVADGARRCSLCGAIFIRNGDVSRPNYCPNCGAKVSPC